MKRTAVTVATLTFWVSLLCTGLRCKDCIAKQLFKVTTRTLGNVICTCIRCLTSCPQRCINLAMTAMTKEKERQRLGKANFPEDCNVFRQLQRLRPLSVARLYVSMREAKLDSDHGHLCCNTNAGGSSLAKHWLVVGTLCAGWLRIVG